MADSEIEAMASIAEALVDLDQAAQQRVLQWAAAGYEVTVSSSADEAMHDRGEGGHACGGNGVDDGDSGDKPSYQHFAELFAAASPTTDADKALVAGYWVQVHDVREQWTSRLLNTELKHLSHALPNITRALTSNIRKKPQRIIQLKKSGSAQQAQKTYKVTAAGTDHVNQMVGEGGA